MAEPSAPTAPDDLTALLHERGQRCTPQRLVILRELRRRADTFGQNPSELPPADVEIVRPLQIDAQAGGSG